jgi:hypothetical protein
MLLFSSELGMAWVFLWISLGLRTREIPWKTHAIPRSDEKSTTLHADQNYETVMKTASLHCNVVVFLHNCISLCSCSSMFHLGGPTQDFTILVQKVYNGRMVALGCGAPVAALASAGQPGGLHWHVLSSGVLLKIARSTASWSKFFVSVRYK